MVTYALAHAPVHVGILVILPSQWSILSGKYKLLLYNVVKGNCISGIICSRYWRHAPVYVGILVILPSQWSIILSCKYKLLLYNVVKGKCIKWHHVAHIGDVGLLSLLPQSMNKRQFFGSYIVKVYMSVQRHHKCFRIFKQIINLPDKLVKLVDPFNS